MDIVRGWATGCSPMKSVGAAVRAQGPSSAVYTTRADARDRDAVAKAVHVMCVPKGWPCWACGRRG